MQQRMYSTVMFSYTVVGGFNSTSTNAAVATRSNVRPGCESAPATSTCQPATAAASTCQSAAATAGAASGFSQVAQCRYSNRQWRPAGAGAAAHVPALGAQCRRRLWRRHRHDVTPRQRRAATAAVTRTNAGHRYCPRAGLRCKGGRG